MLFVIYKIIRITLSSVTTWFLVKYYFFNRYNFCRHRIYRFINGISLHSKLEWNCIFIFILFLSSSIVKCTVGQLLFFARDKKFSFHFDSLFESKWTSLLPIFLEKKSNRMLNVERILRFLLINFVYFHTLFVIYKIIRFDFGEIQNVKYRIWSSLSLINFEISLNKLCILLYTFCNL